MGVLELSLLHVCTKKRNKSGIISIQIIDKSSGKYKLVKTVGSSSDNKTIDHLYLEGKIWIEDQLNQTSLDFSENSEAKQIAKSIKSIDTAGIEILITKIYDEIGFDQIQSEFFRLLIIARISNPVSKLKTLDYLEKYHSINISKDQIYRYLDKLY